MLKIADGLIYPLKTVYHFRSFALAKNRTKSFCWASVSRSGRLKNALHNISHFCTSLSQVSLGTCACPQAMNSNALRYILIGFTLFLALSAKAQYAPPALHCASVNPDGTVQLTWTPVAGVNPATTYRVYRDTGAGFQFVNVVGPSNSTGYFDGLVNANLGAVTYYVTTDFDNESLPSNAVSTLFVQVTPLNLSSIALVNWNAASSIPFVGLYQIERRIAMGAWETIGSQPQSVTSYSDTLHGLCVAPNEDPIQVDYRVRAELAECTSISTIAGGEFQDLLGPAPPQVETVLINPTTGDAEIYWYPSQAPDLEKYIVQSIIQEPGGQVSLNIGSVQAGLSTTYIYQEASLLNSSNLVVIAFDSCGNDNSYLGIFTTMFLKANYTSCGQIADITWNAYQGWTEGIDRYNLYAQIDGAPYEIVAQIPATTNSFSFDVMPNSEYCFYIEALSLGTQRPSTSNAACIATAYPNVVDFAYLSSVSTLDNGSIEIRMHQDIEGVGTRYELFRSREGADFQKTATLEQSTEPFISFIDTDVASSDEQYTYKWRVFDGCGQEIFESNSGRNILLSAAGGSEAAVNVLEWGSYLTWENGVTEYEVQRRLGLDGDFELFAVLGPQSFTFVDDVESFIEDEGYFCYKIVASEVENSFGFSSTAQSNPECVSLPPLMWIPNAIVINGFNTIFKPVAGFIDFESYDMEVRSRWGQILFQSNSIDDGWNGTFDGKRVREDQYQYIIRYRDGAGQLYIRQGAVVVLHDRE